MPQTWDTDPYLATRWWQKAVWYLRGPTALAAACEAHRPRLERDRARAEKQEPARIPETLLDDIERIGKRFEEV